MIEEKAIQEKRRKIFKMKARQVMHRGLRSVKKIGVGLGLWLFMTCSGGSNAFSQNVGGNNNSWGRGKDFSTLLAEARHQNKKPAEFLAMVSEQVEINPEAGQRVGMELGRQVRDLVKDILIARSDSVAATINVIKKPRQKDKEVRRNFADATGTPKYADYCIATQCAADYRALRAMGLGDIIPASLMKNSAYCPNYINDANIKPFCYTVANNSKAIEACIRNNNLKGGCFIFYPRNGGSYHAVSIDMPEGDLVYGEDQVIKISAANREHLNDSINSPVARSFMNQAPGRKVVIVDKQAVFVHLLSQYIEGKTLAEQVNILYSGGAAEFMAYLTKQVKGESNSALALADNHSPQRESSLALALLQKAAAEEGRPMSDLLAETANNMLKNTEDKNTQAAGLLLAMMPLAAKRNRRNRELFEIFDELEQKDNNEDKFNYLIEKVTPKIKTALTPEEYDAFVIAIVSSQMLPEENIASSHEETSWHAVASKETPAQAKTKGKKAPTSPKRQSSARINNVVSRV